MMIRRDRQCAGMAHAARHVLDPFVQAEDFHAHEDDRAGDCTPSGRAQQAGISPPATCDIGHARLSRPGGATVAE